MLKELKFVQGAVGKKEFIPAITHFCIEDGTVRAYNGTIALSSPIACDLNCKPKAIPMVQAIAKCDHTISLSMTPAGRLSIRSGSFKAFIECIEESQAHVQPEGEEIYFDGEVLLAGLKTVQDFIGNDASRPWATGVLLKGQSVFATNNVCLIEYWMGVDFPRVVNVPRSAIAEMIRINEAPTHAQVAPNSITFHYADGRWIRSQLYSSEWPDLSKVLDQPSEPGPVPAGLFQGLDVLRPFMSKLGQVFIKEGFMHTHEDINEGASFDIDWPYKESMFSLEMLSLLEGVAQQVDFNTYPAPCLFYGDRLRGAIIGMRLPTPPQE